MKRTTKRTKANAVPKRARLTIRPMTWAEEFSDLRQEFKRVTELMTLSRDSLRTELAGEYLAVIEAQKVTITDLRLQLAMAGVRTEPAPRFSVNGSAEVPARTER